MVIGALRRLESCNFRSSWEANGARSWEQPASELFSFSFPFSFLFPLYLCALSILGFDFFLPFPFFSQFRSGTWKENMFRNSFTCLFLQDEESPGKIIIKRIVSRSRTNVDNCDIRTLPCNILLDVYRLSDRSETSSRIRYDSLPINTLRYRYPAALPTLVDSTPVSFHSIVMVRIHLFS